VVTESNYDVVVYHQHPHTVTNLCALGSLLVVEATSRLFSTLTSLPDDSRDRDAQDGRRDPGQRLWTIAHH
jgi:hypothetical protein